MSAALRTGQALLQDHARDLLLQVPIKAIPA